MLENRNKELVRIARILTINGEMDRAELGIIFGGNSNEANFFMFRQKKVLTQLKYKYGTSVRANLRGSGKNDLSSFQKLLMDIDKDGRAWKYYEETFRQHGVLKSAKNSVTRHFYIGHVLNFIMDDFDIDVWKRQSLSELVERKMNGESSKIDVNTFFSVREIKYVTEVGKLEYMSSIASGVLLLPCGVHSVYYLQPPVENTIIKKKETPANFGLLRENRFLGHVNRTFRALDSEYIPYNKSKDNAIVIGTNEVAKEIFKGLMNPKMRTAYTFDMQAIQKICFIKDNEDGKKILRLLKIPNMQKLVIENKVQDKKNIITTLATEDAVVNGLPILFWLDGDLVHLHNALSKNRGGQPLYVICEEEYMDLVDELAYLKLGKKAEELVKVSKISVDEIRSIVTKEGRRE